MPGNAPTRLRSAGDGGAGGNGIAAVIEDCHGLTSTRPERWPHAPLLVAGPVLPVAPVCAARDRYRASRPPVLRGCLRNALYGSESDLRMSQGKVTAHARIVALRSVDMRSDEVSWGGYLCTRQRRLRGSIPSALWQARPWGRKTQRHRRDAGAAMIPASAYRFTRRTPQIVTTEPPLRLSDPACESPRAQRQERVAPQRM
jgi:hypothetical protein